MLTTWPLRALLDRRAGAGGGLAERHRADDPPPAEQPPYPPALPCALTEAPRRARATTGKRERKCRMSSINRLPSMIEQLEQLSLAVGPIAKADAKQVAEAINRKIAALMSAQVIKLYWLEEAQNGVLLRPVTFINKTLSRDPMPFQVETHPNGVLSWVFHEKRPLWLEDLQRKDLSAPVRNEADDTEILPNYLDMSEDYRWMDSMMCVPLIVRGDVRGLYSVELQSSSRLTGGFRELLERLAKSLSCLLWNADVYGYDQDKTSRAIEQFITTTASSSFDPIFLEERFRSGFIARPFARDFSDVEEELVALFSSRGVRARRYVPEGRTRYIIDEIMLQIRHSHFGVADITGSNPNVLAEVGMMMSWSKQFMLIRRKGDSSPPPFNVNQYPVYDYELRAGQGLRLWNAPDNKYESFEERLDNFIEQLPPETGFGSADRWMS